MSIATKETCENSEPHSLVLQDAPLDVVKAWLEERGIRGSVQNIHCVRQGLAHILAPEHWARDSTNSP